MLLHLEDFCQVLLRIWNCINISCKEEHRKVNCRYESKKTSLSLSRHFKFQTCCLCKPRLIDNPEQPRHATANQNELTPKGPVGEAQAIPSWKAVAPCHSARSLPSGCMPAQGSGGLRSLSHFLRLMRSHFGRTPLRNRHDG